MSSLAWEEVGDPPYTWLNTLRPRQNGRHFADDIFKCIFLNENVWIPLKTSLAFVPKGPINNIPTLVQVMAWRRPGDKPLSEPMVVNLSTHICVTRPQWVNERSNDIGANLRVIDGFMVQTCAVSKYMEQSTGSQARRSHTHRFYTVMMRHKRIEACRGRWKKTFVFSFRFRWS